MRVVLAVNARLSRDAAAGPGKVGYALARRLYDRGRLGRVVCTSADISVELPAEMVLETQPSPWTRKAFAALQRIGRELPALPLRRIGERHFDAVASRKLQRNWGDVLFCTKPTNPELIERARQFGWPTVLSTSVLHPRWNLRLVEREQQRLGLKDASVYTDERRVRHLERALKRVDKIIAPNAFFETNYVQQGTAADKIVLFNPERPHEGVDVARFRPPASGLLRDGRFRVLHVSHMSLIKGVQYLLDAWRQIEAEIDGELVLAGSYDANVKELLRRSHVRKLRLTGPIDPFDEYRQASVFVSPSISDAAPNTVFEAMACGTPAIASDHCGVSRFIDHGVNGLIYPYQDSQRLADLILECYRNPEKRLAIARQALVTARNFPLGDYAADLLEVLERASRRDS